SRLPGPSTPLRIASSMPPASCRYSGVELSRSIARSSVIGPPSAAEGAADGPPARPAAAPAADGPAAEPADDPAAEPTAEPLGVGALSTTLSFGSGPARRGAGPPGRRRARAMTGPAPRIRAVGFSEGVPAGPPRRHRRP